MGVGAGVIGLGIIGSFTDPPQPEDRKPAAAPSPVASTSDTPAPSPSANPLCNATGTAPKAPDASGPHDHVRLGKLTCAFEDGKLDDAEVPVTITNKGAKAANYTVTVELLDAADAVIKSNDNNRAYDLAPGKSKTVSAILIGWGSKIETDGKGYKTRLSVVEREEPEPPEPLPTETPGTSGTTGDTGDAGMPTITPGAFCGDGDTVGISKKGRIYHCRDRHWRR